MNAQLDQDVSKFVMYEFTFPRKLCQYSSTYKEMC